MIRRHHAIKAAAVAAATLGLVSCASTGTGADDPVVTRAEPASSATADLARALNAVGFDVFHAALKEGEDTAVSPLSIGLAFGMLDAGATGGVADALAGLFAYPVEGDARLEAFNALEQAASADPAGFPEPEEWQQEHATVSVANRVFTDTDFAPLDAYREAMARYFGAGAQVTPMSTDGDRAAEDINGWVDERTRGLIPTLVTPDFFTSDSRLVLVNALYMKAAWATPFDEADTSDEDFTLLDGEVTQVPMMYAGDPWGAVATGDDYVAVTLPYAYEELEMVLVVPDEGAYADVEAALDQDWLDAFDAAAGSADFTLAMPRFTTESKVDLREVIETGLGVNGLFDEIGLDGIGPELMLSSGVHATKVVVNEAGTEAAAATALGVMAGSAPGPAPEPLEIRADRPFLYVIRDVETGAVLFVGRVLDPR